MQTTIFSVTAKEKSYVFMANGLIAYVHVCIFGKRFGGFFFLFLVCIKYVVIKLQLKS